jgi:hypothetical protein
MQCANCGKAFDDTLAECPHCHGGEIVADWPKPLQPKWPVPTTRKAVASLVLGLLVGIAAAAPLASTYLAEKPFHCYIEGVALCGLPLALVGFALGLWITMSERRIKGRGIALAGCLISATALVLVMVMVEFDYHATLWLSQ